MELRSVPYSQFRSIRIDILDRLPASCNNGFHELGLENLTAISFVLGVRTSKRDLARNGVDGSTTEGEKRSGEATAKRKTWVMAVEEEWMFQ